VKLEKKSIINRIPKIMRYKRPKTKHHLRDYIKFFLDVDIPYKVLSDEHKSMMDYLWFAFNSDFLSEKKSNCDCVVWANRAGGKTETAAIATLLDCIFKPKIQIRILSGSGYQAGRMYEYFERFIHMGFEGQIADVKNHPVRSTRFINGAIVEVLVQSETSVRGQHVNKLRCDEVELFKPRVFEAAQYTTESSNGYTAALELISTMHKPYGLMRKLVKRAQERGVPIFKWNLWDVVEKCRRRCKDCPLDYVCKGKAHKSRGFLKVDDAITQLDRSSRSSFNLEMLCGEGSKKKGYGGTCGCRLY
jgi:hypothetical protein